MKKLNKLYGLITDAVMKKYLDDSDIDLLITSVKMLLEEKSKKRRKW